MQYEITLPADYDMTVIRQRVAQRGAAMDDFPGLGVKVYGIREQGKRGSTVNQYAPFYVWADVKGMQTFLWGVGFKTLSADFGRPRVHHWTGVGHVTGAAHHHPPVFATRRVLPVPADTDLEAWIKRSMQEAERHAADPRVHSTAFAVDPSRWQAVRFTLWTADAPEHDGDTYEILHVSSPEEARL
jgi:hypothetical protein